MDYPIGYDRILMIILLMAYISRVDGRAAVPPDAGQVESASPQSPQPWTALGALGRETVNASHRALWGVSKLLLSAGRSVNTVWDAALDAVLSALRTVGAAYGALAARVARVPIVGYGAGGAGEVIRVVLDAAESNARHDMQVRRHAFAELTAKLEESGRRLSGGAGDASPGTAAPAGAGGTVHFPGQ